ncbi:AraC family transcriptional regulator [Pseudoxanthomonas winnipegensis]|jgi:AraC-like DNA-binding protein|uniref:AraC family transcriptional regulator n=1 Tax=Pseudoxanthomonas winnipegensis TaxID=2480810 RepID=A0ABY1WAU7_9GAMM|nr:AraC family transcriptional regulator [Pseudoxanthomonas winnipegensis]TAA07640.1 AraC family transcriptional regulator [Pseudoxanthomonas winnipegensis]TAA17666.1 AraC family transcriptional regulator [Pseudoxanthomonas winnipegensis]TAH71385.1 AraC family transcriptional regulator [Pseudoxanthomonas winnipegensis]
MASLQRLPVPALRGLVASVWAHEPAAPRTDAPATMRECVLPTGATHLAVRIGGAPLRVFDHASDRCGHLLGHAVVGGVRTAYHVRDVAQPAISVGAMLRPGATAALFGAPESALAGHHTSLELLLPAGEVDALLALLHACGDGSARLAAFEGWLIRRAGGQRPILHPALAVVLRRPWCADLRVEDMVRASGLSHRHCIAVFRQATGLAPSQWLRLQRFSHAIDLACGQASSWAEIAASCGFADQAHLANTFRDVAGLTPSAWRRLADPAAPRHVPR